MEAPFKDNFKVFVRIRPFLSRETRDDLAFPVTDVLPGGTSLHVYEFAVSKLHSRQEINEILANPKYYQVHQFQFDRIFDEGSTQSEVFEQSLLGYIGPFLAGFNCSIFAYGQTGTGKTYSVEGSALDPGLMFRAVEEVFERTKGLSASHHKLSVSYLQIYNEIIFDLLDDVALNVTQDVNGYAKKLQIKSAKDRGVFVDGLKELRVESASQASGIIRQGIANRFSASNNLNAVSSRSHAVFTLIFERKGEHGVTYVSKLNIIDLAGSERITLTGVSAERLTETKRINTSLSELSNVILQLSKKKDRNDFVQYRNSKLTRLLEDSLGGNTMTSFIATVSPSHLMLEETLSTLKFAARARNIKTTVTQSKRSDSGGHLKILERIKRHNSASDQEMLKIDNISEILPSSLGDARHLYSRNGKSDPWGQDLDGKDEKDRVIEAYQEMLNTQRDVIIQMTTRLNNKHLEIATMKKKMSENRDTSNEVSLRDITDLKEGIDFVVDSLSQRHKKVDLQGIVGRLLSLQAKCGQIYAEKTGKAHKI